MASTLALFGFATVVMLVLFPELKQKRRDAIIAGSMMALAFALSMLNALDLWTTTIDQMLTTAFKVVVHPSTLIGR